MKKIKEMMLKTLHVTRYTLRAKTIIIFFQFDITV